jgi:solute carrier family 35 protein E3
MVEKRPSTDGLVDNIDGLPTYEKPVEPAPSTVKAKLITCLWIALNTFSTLGLIFLSKR